MSKVRRVGWGKETRGGRTSHQDISGLINRSLFCVIQRSSHIRERLVDVVHRVCGEPRVIPRKLVPTAAQAGSDVVRPICPVHWRHSGRDGFIRVTSISPRTTVIPHPTSHIHEKVSGPKGLSPSKSEYKYLRAEAV